MSAKKNFYAIAHGRKTGIFTSWPEASAQVTGFSGSRYKGFVTRSEADQWLTEQQGQKEITQPMAIHSRIAPVALKPKVNTSQSSQLDEGLVVYCDGSCLNNGASNARAGFGVYFGKNDSRNLSVRVDPAKYPQTNQVAELLAAIYALTTLHSYGSTITIRTDSIYVVKSVNEWRHSWKKGNWTKKLTNLELLRRLSDLVDARLPAKTYFKHVKGHSGHFENDQVDLLARAGAMKEI